ncbi:hypothetical protein Y032_0079g1242 [Ancylostoma ceylanicum]|uniref:Uncharacterized protein n=1 Tax=Ancylostoma ceylanicum TaxID=53326 RepID=A0A016TS63_9BILA|nr:hypothetical protein Y032_0079g1242 [Ancylostoma ceylanicum]
MLAASRRAELIIRSIDGSLVEAFCKFGSKNCSSTFRSIFEREVQRRCGDGEKASQCVRVPRHFRGCTYCYGVKELGKTALEKVGLKSPQFYFSLDSQENPAVAV